MAKTRRETIDLIYVSTTHMINTLGLLKEQNLSEHSQIIRTLEEMIDAITDPDYAAIIRRLNNEDYEAYGNLLEQLTLCLISTITGAKPGEPDFRKYLANSGYGLPPDMVLLFRSPTEYMLEPFKVITEGIGEIINGLFPPDRPTEDLIIDDAFYLQKSSNGTAGGWRAGAPQAIAGYADTFDERMNDIFNIHATKFALKDENQNVIAELRLWKGSYAGMPGGEIGFYGSPERVTNKDMKDKVVEVVRGFLAFLKLDNPPNAEDLLAEDIGTISEKLEEMMVLSTHNLLCKTAELAKEQGLLNLLKSFFAGVRVSLTVTFEALLHPHLTVLAVRKQAISFTEGMIKLYKEMEDDSADFKTEWGHSMTEDELSHVIGLSGTRIQVFHEGHDNRPEKLLDERYEPEPEFWTTTFALDEADINAHAGENVKNHLYTVNYFYFEDEVHARWFEGQVTAGLDAAEKYIYNNGEKINQPTRNGRTVIIEYGDRENR